MRYFQIFLVAALTCVAAWAQPGVIRDTSSTQVVPGQRRAELRSDLNVPVPNGRKPQDKDQGAADSPAAKRHLSEQERVDLRQQLNQLHGDFRLVRP